MKRNIFLSLTTAILLIATACSGSFTDPGMLDQPGGGTSGGGGWGTGGGGGTTTGIQITTTSLPNGKVGVPYSQTLTATDTTNNTITWRILSGSLPNGVGFSSTGVIAGTPTEAGTFNFTVEAKATNVVKSSTKAFSIVIARREGDSKETAIPLTLNTWANGNLLTLSDVQWFSFTATASTQYIYVNNGTSTTLLVQVYDSNNTAVGEATQFPRYTKYISMSLTPGQTYYIKVSTSYSIGNSTCTYKIGFNTSWVPPPGAIQLTLDTWTDGNLPTSSDEQWFSFTATASTQYIHVNYGMMTSLYVQVYNSSGTTVGSETQLLSSITATLSKYTSLSVTSGQTYYIRVRLYPNSGSGTYKIGFTEGFYPPETTITQLTLNTWADGNIPTSSDEQWFYFIATASTQYIHVDFGTLTSLYVDAVGSESRLDNSTYTSRSVTLGQTYYIKVSPYNSNYKGTYRIGFTTSTTPPQN
ncbi:hypothetical protein [Treponema sp. R6D11]